jgi:hypothetical protein
VPSVNRGVEPHVGGLLEAWGTPRQVASHAMAAKKRVRRRLRGRAIGARTPTSMALRPHLLAPVGFLVPLIGLFAGSPARAADSPSDSKAADVLFENARAAMNRGDLATACPQFAESQRLDPAPGTLLNLGECEARAGKVASALAHFRDARAQLPAGDYRIAFAEARMAGLVKRIPQLTLKLTGATASASHVQCDGADVPAASLGTPQPADPGTHVCVVRAPGRADARADVTLREGEAKTLELSPGPAASSGDEPSASSSPGSAAGSSDAPIGNGQRTAGLLVGGAGLAAVAVGSVFGFLSKSTYNDAQSHCPNGNNSCDPQGVQGGNTAYNQALISDVALIGGAVLLAGGAVLYFTAPSGSRVGVTPAVGAHSAGLTLGAAW